MRGYLKTILVTSILPGEGKSWVSSNLAVTFARAGKKVIIVDADMRKGRQYSIFGLSPRPGLSNYLSGVDENYKENGFVVPYGESPLDDVITGEEIYLNIINQAKKYVYIYYS